MKNKKSKEIWIEHLKKFKEDRRIGNANVVCRHVCNVRFAYEVYFLFFGEKYC